MEFKPFKTLRIRLKPKRNIAKQTYRSAMENDIGKLFCFICCREEPHQQPVDRNELQDHDHNDDEENSNSGKSKDDIKNIKKDVYNFIKRVIRYKRLSDSKAKWLSNEEGKHKSDSDLHACKSCVKIIQEINITDDGLATVIAKAHKGNSDEISDLWMVMHLRLKNKIKEVYNTMQNVQHKARRYCETYWAHRAVEYEIKEIDVVDIQGFRTEFMKKFQNQNATENPTEIANIGANNDIGQIIGNSSYNLHPVAQTNFPNQPSSSRQYYTTQQPGPGRLGSETFADKSPLSVKILDDDAEENATSQNDLSQIQPPPSKKRRTTQLAIAENGCNTENDRDQIEFDNTNSIAEERRVRKRHFTTNATLPNSKAVETPLAPLVNSKGSSSDTKASTKSTRELKIRRKSSGSANERAKSNGMMPSNPRCDDMNMLKKSGVQIKPTRMETRKKLSLPRNQTEQKSKSRNESSTITTKAGVAERKKKGTVTVPRRKLNSKKIQTLKKIAKGKVSSQPRKSSNLNFQKKKCSKCSKMFSNCYNLKTHLKTIHEGKKPFACELCGERFTQNSHLKKHRGGERCTEKRESMLLFWKQGR